MERVAQEPQSTSAATQLQARLVATQSRKERGDRHLQARIVDILDSQNWLTRRQVLAVLNRDPNQPKVTDDELRAAARYSNGEIIGSSRRGYCLTRRASVADVGAVISEWLSRSKQLRARVAEVLQVLHGRPRSRYQFTTRDEAVQQTPAAQSDTLGGAA